MDNRRLTPRFSLMSSLTYRAAGTSRRGFLVSLSEGGCTLEESRQPSAATGLAYEPAIQ